MTIKINGVEVKVGQIWKTRDEMVLKVTSIEEQLDYPIRCGSYSFTSDGSYFTGTVDGSDLVSLYKDIEQPPSTAPTTRRKYYEAIVAWAEGKTVQVREVNTEDQWEDFIDEGPAFDSYYWEWRVKPVTITKKYRLALLEDNSVMAVDVTDASLDNLPGHDVFGFVKWVSDVVAVIIEV